MSPCRTIVSCASPETVPRRLNEPLEPSGARVDASDRFRAWPRRPGVDVDDDDLCENEGDALDPGADVGGGAGWCGPWAFRFLGELVYSRSDACDAARCRDW